MNDFYNSTHAKSMRLYFGYAPKKVERAKGVRIFDCEGNKYLDCGMALGSVSLGYAYDKVDEFVIEAIKKGVNFSRPSYWEEELVWLLNKKLGFPLGVKFSKSSSMLLSVVPRVSRYLTGKTHVAYPSNGAYLGNTDWFLSQARAPGGILKEVQARTITFEAGNLNALIELFEKHASHLACIIMEPFREKKFDTAYYQALSTLCLKHRVLLVFDETVSGFRFADPLAQSSIDCRPDFTIVGKAIANGYALSAVIGNQEIMKDIESAVAKGKVYGFSNTHAGESIGLAAAIKTLEVYETENVVAHMNTLGKGLMEDMKKAIANSALRDNLGVVGQPAYFHLSGSDWEIVERIKEEVTKFFFQHRILFRGTMSMCLDHKKYHIKKISDVFTAYCNQFNLKNSAFDKNLISAT